MASSSSKVIIQIETSQAAQIEGLKDLMRGINKRNGSVNCGHVALRLDDNLREGRVTSDKPVTTQNARIETLDHLNENGETYRSEVSDKRFVERILKGRVVAEERYDLTEDNKTLIELDFDLDDIGTCEHVKIKLLKTDLQSINEQLQAMPRRKKDGSSYGFIVATHQNNKKSGHISNFFVDNQNHVYFLDAQPKEESEWVRTAFNIKGFENELFFINSKPPEGFLVKQENSPTQDLKIKDELFTLSESNEPPALEHAKELTELAPKSTNEMVMAPQDTQNTLSSAIINLVPNTQNSRQDGTSVFRHLLAMKDEQLKIKNDAIQKLKQELFLLKQTHYLFSDLFPTIAAAPEGSFSASFLPRASNIAVSPAEPNKRSNSENSQPNNKKQRTSPNSSELDKSSTASSKPN